MSGSELVDFANDLEELIEKARDLSEKSRQRPLSLVVTKLEEAELWLSKVKSEDSDSRPDSLSDAVNTARGGDTPI